MSTICAEFTSGDVEHEGNGDIRFHVHKFICRMVTTGFTVINTSGRCILMQLLPLRSLGERQESSHLLGCR